MPSFYHGSIWLFLADIGKRIPKEIRNATKLITGNRKKKDNKSILENRFGQLIKHGKIEEAKCEILLSVENAKKNNDASKLHYLAAALERLEIYNHAYKTRACANAILDKSTGQKWDGRHRKNQDLIVYPITIDRNSISYAIQYASIIKLVAERVKSCLVFLDDRLIPLFSRSFPTVKFRSLAEISDAEMKHANQNQLYCGLENLPEYFGASDEEIRAAHVPLVPDPALVAILRNEYAVGSKPVIGIAWGSKNSSKDVPKFRDWEHLLTGLCANIVSLQYGPVEAAIKKIEHASHQQIILDDSIDQLANIDDFAAQLASLDAIVTVSNTGAHLAGILGVPMIVLLDDKFHLTWPYSNSRTPWYPNARMIRKNERKWPQVMQEARKILEKTLNGKSIVD